MNWHINFNQRTLSSYPPLFFCLHSAQLSLWLVVHSTRLLSYSLHSPCSHPFLHVRPIYLLWLLPMDRRQRFWLLNGKCLLSLSITTTPQSASHHSSLDPLICFGLFISCCRIRKRKAQCSAECFWWHSNGMKIEYLLTGSMSVGAIAMSMLIVCVIDDGHHSNVAMCGYHNRILMQFFVAPKGGAATTVEITICGGGKLVVGSA